MSFIRAPGKNPIRIIEWHVKVGETVHLGTAILTYRPIENAPSSPKEKKLRSNAAGKVTKLFSDRPGQAAEPGSTLMELDPCSHTMVIHDMCGECGQDLRKLQEHSSAHVSMIANVPELMLSTERAEQIGKLDFKSLHKRRKLSLLVDLDQTIIHTTQNPLHAKIAAKNPDTLTFQLDKHDRVLYTKLRPGCRQFLNEMSELFDLKIVTFGSRNYANEISKFIDPDRKLFGYDILTRDESRDSKKKSENLRHMFPCGPHMVCIIDDREDVWGGYTNLVLVKKYSYFPGSGDINSPDRYEDNKSPKSVVNEQDTSSSRKRKSESAEDDPSPKKANKSEGTDEVADMESGKTDSQSESSSSESQKESVAEEENGGDKKTSSEDPAAAGDDSVSSNGNDDDKKDPDDDGVLVDTDNYLERLKEILKEVHETYYRAHDKYVAKTFNDKPDVQGIVPFLRSKVLYGCELVMTGIIPNQFQFPHERHRSYIVARQLGAVIKSEVSESTTHLICGKKGTIKYQNAVKMGKKINIVNIDWLYECSDRWQRMDESDYPVKATRRKSADQAAPAAVAENTTKPQQEIPTGAERYDPITGKLIRKVKDPRFEFRVAEAMERVQNKKLLNPVYSSLKHPDAVIPIERTPPPLTNTYDPDVTPAFRQRKPSMKEMIPIDTYLSSSVIADMKAEVDSLDSSDEEEEEDKDEELGTSIEGGNLTDIRSNNSSQSDKCSSDSDDDDDDDDNYDEMEKMMCQELHYDDDDDDDDDELDGL